MITDLSYVTFEGEQPDKNEDFDLNRMGTFNDGIILGFIKRGSPTKHQNGEMFWDLRREGNNLFEGGVHVKPKSNRSFWYSKQNGLTFKEV